MTEAEDHRELHDELEGEAGELERSGNELQEETSAVREDWERKQSDEGVPGAEAEPQDGPVVRRAGEADD